MASHHQHRDAWAEINARPSTLRPFGSALGSQYAGTVERCPLIGRTVKPRAAGPCKVCGERRFFCDCDNGEGDPITPSTEGTGGANNASGRNS